jgi:geranylgeranyl diphosphate synthase type I
MATDTTVPSVLFRARDLVVPALRAAVDLLAPELQGVAAYHLGWVDELGTALAGDGGKGVRPALAVLSAEAVGAAGRIGVPGAAAIELVHNYSLIHDDVMDNDRERRHRATVWTVFGVPQAIIVGDALAALAVQLLLDPALLVPEVGQSEGSAAARLLTEATAKMIAGQSQDMAFEERERVTFAECIAMEAGKTGALLGCASSIGAVLAGAGSDTVAALDRFGVELGISFQAVDDLLGIWGDPKTTGKPRMADLRQHKKSLPVTFALSSGAAIADELAALLQVSELSEEQIVRMATIVEECGGREATNALADERLRLALASLESAAITDSAHEEFREIARFVVERQF